MFNNLLHKHYDRRVAEELIDIRKHLSNTNSLITTIAKGSGGGSSAATIQGSIRITGDPARTPTISSQGTAPISPQVDDIWYDSTDVQLKRWTGGEWEIIGSKGTYIDANGVYTGTLSANQIITSTLSVIGTSQLNNDAGFVTSSNAGNKTSYQSTAPTSPSVGDLWYDTSIAMNYILKRWNGSSWATMSVYADSSGLYAGNITAGQVTAGTFTGLIFQTAATNQRVIVDTTNGGQIRFYDGSNNNIVKIGDNVYNSTAGLVVSNGLLCSTNSVLGGTAIIGVATGNVNATSMTSLATGTGINYAMRSNAYNGTANYSFYGDNGTLYNREDLIVGASKFTINTNGQITKVNNLTAAVYTGYALISDGTSFTPTAISSSGGIFGNITSNFSTASSSYVDVTGLSVSVVASSSYHFTLFIVAGNTSGGDIQLVVPSGTTFNLVGTESTSAPTIALSVWHESLGDKYFVDVQRIYQYQGKLTTSSTAGTVKLQAKVLSSGSTTVFSNSEIFLQKI